MSTTDAFPVLPGHVVALKDLSPTTVADALTEPSVNLALHSRPVPTWASAVDDLVADIVEPYQFWLVNEDIDVLGERLRAGAGQLPGGHEEAVDALFDDVIALASVVSEACGDTRPFVSLRTIDASYFTAGASSVSSHMHLDTATVTLSCTYVGAGTEWTPDSNVIREQFGTRKMQRPDEPLGALVHDPDLVHESVRYEVSLLKGEIREDEDEGSLDFLSNFLEASEIERYNVGGGLLHRGPGTARGTRLLLTVSTMRVPRFSRVPAGSL
ncbi:DUF1826 domain-containing protein [Streptomyces venezuelae]|uniref:DUF1826 domain-containing protein n=1 Tax=Streptomyces venezuelae TaxID=54571 RepID=UPI0036510BB3